MTEKGSDMREEGGGASRSTDPAQGTSAATDVSLREHLTALIENSRKECKANVDSLRQQFLAAETSNAEAIKTALIAIDKRFDGVNEFRAALSDLSKQMATQVAVDNLGEKAAAANLALESKFEALYNRNRDDINQIIRRIDTREGQDVGSKITTTTLVTVVSVGILLVGVIVSIVSYLSNR